MILKADTDTTETKAETLTKTQPETETQTRTQRQPASQTDRQTDNRIEKRHAGTELKPRHQLCAWLRGLASVLGLGQAPENVGHSLWLGHALRKRTRVGR